MRRMMKARNNIAGWSLSLVILAMSLPAFAAGNSGHAADGHVPSDDHWSIFASIVPESGLNNFRYMFGATLTGQAAPSRVMHVIIGFVVLVLGLFLAIRAAAKTKQDGVEALLPENKLGLFTVFELPAAYFFNTMEDLMGKKKATFFFPLIMSLAVFIFLSNILGAIPGFLPATDNLNTTLALGLVVFVVTHIYGIKEHGAGAYFAHFLGPMRSPAWLPLMILMLFIEIISHIARPISLGIRLMGNMYGDHAVLGVFLGFGFLLVPLPVMVLGTVVAIVQTLVFCLLSIVYIALAVEHAEDH